MKKLVAFFVVVMAGGLYLKSHFSRQNLVAEVDPVSPAMSAEPTPEPVVHRAPPPSAPAVPVREAAPAPESPFAKTIESARQAKSPEAARAILEKALKDNSESPELLAEMGMLYLTGLNQPAKALGYFEQSLAIDGNNGEITSLAANIYVKEKMGARGAKFLSDLMQRFPDNPTIPVALADILAKQGRPAEGVELLEDAKRRAQDGQGFSPYLGMYYLNNGNTAKAIEVFQGRLSEQESAEGAKDPMAVEYARLDLANAYLKHGNVTEAENLAKAVLERQPSDKFAKDLLEQVQKAREQSGSPRM